MSEAKYSVSGHASSVFALTQQLVDLVCNPSFIIQHQQLGGSGSWKNTSLPTFVKMQHQAVPHLQEPNWLMY